MAEPDCPIVLIPAHNEEATVGTIVAQVRLLWSCPVVVIDDCSSDTTAQACPKRWRHRVAADPTTFGAWGAIQTGLRYAAPRLSHRHHPRRRWPTRTLQDISLLLQPLIDGQAAVAIGAFPERASRARRIAWNYFRWLTGLKLEDITSGFRAYNHAAMIVLASREASLLDYQDVGVLLILRRKGLHTIEVPVAMQRVLGASRVFRPGGLWENTCCKPACFASPGSAATIARPQTDD